MTIIFVTETLHSVHFRKYYCTQRLHHKVPQHVFHHPRLRHVLPGHIYSFDSTGNDGGQTWKALYHYFFAPWVQYIRVAKIPLLNRNYSRI